MLTTKFTNTVDPAQVAINWVATQPGIAAAIVGASNAGQLAKSTAALDFEIPAELRTLLDEASAVPGRRCTACSPRRTRTGSSART
ncbi:aldo/keto reductase [Amycolatopsis sp. DG1A-15b]|nr:aldo/keto reductase [Amycolatopsis sp. DG1A-15b]WIX84872.1 aldo/keto reductase [Amycolatopsis sp. DG1A-15b]